MTLATYAELKTAIADTLARDDLTDTQLSGFIRMAEAAMGRSVRHWRMQSRVTANIDSRFYDLPDDYIETLRFHRLDGARMDLVPHAELQDRRAASLTAGSPTMYAHVAGGIEVYPVPDASYEVELIYFAALPALSDVATTNWLLTYHPDAYLYGSLVHSAPFLQEDARLQTWGVLFSAAVEGINAENRATVHSGTGLRKRSR